MKIAVSFLKSNNYKECIKKINKTKCDYLHVDMCDGNYVEDKNFTIKPLIDTLNVSTKPLDVHMMVKDPLKYIDKLAMLNIETITIHIDCNDSLKTVDYIKSIGIKAGIAINPNQDVSLLKPYLEKVDEILIMSVVPGKGGQVFIESTLDKIDLINSFKKDYHFITAVDGGINGNTIQLLKDKNIDLVISGSFITQSDDYDSAIKLLNI